MPIYTVIKQIYTFTCVVLQTLLWLREILKPEKQIVETTGITKNSSRLYFQVPTGDVPMAGAGEPR